MVYIDLFLDSLYNSEEHECNYFPNRKAMVKAFVLDSDFNGEEHDYIFSKGFRRSKDLYYIPVCNGCQECISYRLEVQKFVLSKSQRRVLKKNSDLTFVFNKPKSSKLKEEIYLRYQYHQHHLKPISSESEEFNEVKQLQIMKAQMYSNPSSSLEMNIYLEEKLLGFAIIDVGHESISAVYSVYDIDYKKRGLGNFFILQSILLAKQLDYKYYYLGLYIPNHFKMEYKNKFQPAEILDPHTKKWKAFNKNENLSISQ